ncbi:MAG: EAL domain-containing protein [Solobacterium sp.]|nr:EAL domain-containing protein [Solobacterium sp.]
MKDRDNLENLWEFIHLITDKANSDHAAENAVSFIAESLNIGRLIGELQTVPDTAHPDGYYEKREFYTSEDGFVREDSCSISYDVKEPGKVTLTAFGKPGKPITDREQVVAVMELVNLAAESHFMMGKADRQKMIQFLTGLPNAAGYMQEISRKYRTQVIDQYDAYYFNLASFGLINKQFGQKESDEVMKRYAGFIRSTLEDDEVLGHLGGDNYVALIRQGENSLKFRELLKNVDTYAMRSGKRIPLSIGAVAGVMRIEPLTPAEQIISGPAVACSFAKRTRVPLVELDDALNERIQRRKVIEQSFEKALANDEFAVFYQPKVDALTGEMIGAEALARWFENGQMIPPGAFIPVLEDSYRITELDLAVFRKVCRDVAGWEKEGHVVPVSVNISRQDLLDRDLFRKLESLIQEYGISRDNIIVEITETSTEREKGLMMDFLNHLKENGIQSSIDDFGTGYSSLSILREFPVSEIKLDRSFINKDLNRKDEIIIHSVIEMARKLDISIIQEGVEDAEQRDFITKLGCTRIQGFLYSRPLPKELYDIWVKRGRCPD